MDAIINAFGMIIITILFLGSMIAISKANSPDEMLKEVKERERKRKAKEFEA